MKKVVTFIGAGVILVSLALNLVSFKAPSDAKQGEIIMIEVYEIPSFKDNGIHIYYPDGTFEDILFNDMKKENKHANGTAIVSTLNKLQKRGYEVTEVGSGLASAGMITKIFMTKTK